MKNKKLMTSNRALTFNNSMLPKRFRILLVDMQENNTNKILFLM